eukprot:5270105-Amphidinium_carterae.1
MSVKASKTWMNMGYRLMVRLRSWMVTKPLPAVLPPHRTNAVRGACDDEECCSFASLATAPADWVS